MIFVTVGTTYFDDLIREVDRLAGAGLFEDEVICQIGSGEYEPRCCAHFRMTDRFDDYLDQCALVISHGGMTVMEAVWRNKPVIAVANTTIDGNHQAVFLREIETLYGVPWTDDVGDLERLAADRSFQGYDFAAAHLSTYILDKYLS